MAKFFIKLQEYQLLSEWTELLDWLLDDSRFSKERWDKTKKDKFTRQAKKVNGLSKENWIWDANKRLQWNKQKPKQPFVQMQKGSSQGEDLIKHIRNGIAHGKTNIQKIKDSLWIEIEDTNKQGEPTAYLWIPISYIKDWYIIYKVLKVQSMVGKRNKKTKVS